MQEIETNVKNYYNPIRILAFLMVLKYAALCGIMML